MTHHVKVLLIALASVGLASCAVVTPGSRGSNEIPIAGLLSLTGNWNTLGRASEAAMQIAAEDANAQFARDGVPTRIRVVVADTKLEPAQALAEMSRLRSTGVRVFVGPQSSSEVAAVREAAAANGSIVISQGSTASSLSIPGDHVFRMVPDDRREAAALVALLRLDGITAIAPMWRNDAGNQGLFNSVTARFQAAGGATSAGVRYEAATTDFRAGLARLRAHVTALLATHPRTTAVYLAAFDEAAPILAAAASDPVLRGVKWYGSDGTVQSKAIIAHAAGAAFAVQSGYPNPIFGLDESRASVWRPIARKIERRSGVEADAFALAAYDAVRLAALAAHRAGGAADVDRLKAEFVATASTYVGANGPARLDAAGDRDAGNFEFWAVRAASGRHTWRRVAVFDAATGSITRIR